MSATQTAVRPTIRWTIKRDLPAIADLDWLGTDLAWTETDYIEQCRQRNVICLTAEVGETTVGAMVYELHAGFIHLRRIVVHPEWRGKHIGAALVGKLKAKLAHQARTTITCDAPDANLAFLLWLRGQRFVATGCDHDSGTVQFRYDLPTD